MSRLGKKYRSLGLHIDAVTGERVPASLEMRAQFRPFVVVEEPTFEEDILDRDGFPAVKATFAEPPNITVTIPLYLLELDYEEVE